MKMQTKTKTKTRKDRTKVKGRRDDLQRTDKLQLERSPIYYVGTFRMSSRDRVLLLLNC